MREIKFRARDKKEKKIKVPKTLTWIGDQLDRMTTVFNDKPIYEGDDFYLMQFTGLHDKYGKEIYEGDIVEWNLLGGSLDGKRISRMQVEIKIINGRVISFPQINSTSKVIGNIYENPELLRANDGGLSEGS